MQNKVKTQTKKHVDAGYEISIFALNVGIGLAAMTGLWALASLIGGLTTNNIGEVLRGLWVAITGI